MSEEQEVRATHEEVEQFVGKLRDFNDSFEDVESVAPLPLANGVGSCRDLLQSHEGSKIVDNAVRKTC